MQNSIKVSGRVEATLKDRFGNIVGNRVRRNLVVNTGLSQIVDLLQALSPRQVKFIELGAGSTSVAAGDSALTDRLTITNARREATIAEVGGGTIQFIKTWTGTEIEYTAVEEAGLFSCSEGGQGTMLAHVTFTAINKTSSVELQLDWRINMSVS